MQTEHIVRYRRRDITAADVEFIPWLDCGASDRASPVLSKILCTAWNWKQENGALRDLVARELMLALHRANQIELPPVRGPALDQSARRPVPPLAGPASTNAAAELGTVARRSFRST